MSEITIKPELKTTPTKDGLRQIFIRITQNRQHIRKTVETDTKQLMKITSNQWSGETGKWINNKHPTYKAWNQIIQLELAKYGREHKKLSDNNLVTSKTEVFEAVNKVIYKQDFLSYFDATVKEIKNWNSEKIYNGTKIKIIAFQGKKKAAKTNSKNLNSDEIDFELVNKPFDFSEMTPKWLEEFEEFLLKDIGVVAATMILKKIKRVWNLAMSKKENIVNKELYPFGNPEDGKYRIPSTKNLKKILERLTEAEIQSLFKCQYGNTDVYDTIDQKFYVQKGFLLAFLCAGIRMEDLLCLKWSNEKAEEFVYIMSKGVAKGKIKKFGKNQQIQGILNDLRPETYQQDDFILPFLKKGIDQDKSKEGQKKLKKAIASSTAIYNKVLKKIGTDIGTTKNMTSHLARHSWAAIMFERTADIKLIQENLDHENIETTIGYIGQLTTKKNDEKLSNVYDALTSNNLTKLKKVA